MIKVSDRKIKPKEGERKHMTTEGTNLLNGTDASIIFLQLGLGQGSLKVGDTGFKVSKFH